MNIDLGGVPGKKIASSASLIAIIVLFTIAAGAVLLFKMGALHDFFRITVTPPVAHAATGS